MNKPVAVLISDVHYNINNLKLADAAMRQAIDFANKLNVPLIVAGDLHDTKASLRGECVKAMLDTWRTSNTPTFVLCGNHDLINEKSQDNSLEFLASHTRLIKTPTKWRDWHFLPYFSDPDACRAALKQIPEGSTVIMHQGLTKAWAGEYVHDKSAIHPEDVANFRVISGHYHRAQDIKCGPSRKGEVGTFSYIGSPYTISYAEANDGPKGFRPLYDDGGLELVPTNLRRHVIIECTEKNFGAWALAMEHLHPNAGDLLWLKVKGPSLYLAEINREDVAKAINMSSFKLDLIPTDTPVTKADEVEGMKNDDILDKLIDESSEGEAAKAELKALWREIV